MLGTLFHVGRAKEVSVLSKVLPAAGVGGYNYHDTCGTCAQHRT